MAKLSIQDELITMAKSGFMQKKTHNVSLFCLNAIQILYCPDSAWSILRHNLYCHFLSYLHVLSPFSVVSFLSNPCTITLDPTEPRIVTKEHFASAFYQKNKSIRDGSSSTCFSTLLAFFITAFFSMMLSEEILKQDNNISWEYPPTISLNIH